MNLDQRFNLEGKVAVVIGGAGYKTALGIRLFYLSGDLLQGGPEVFYFVIARPRQ